MEHHSSQWPRGVPMLSVFGLTRSEDSSSVGKLVQALEALGPPPDSYSLSVSQQDQPQFRQLCGSAIRMFALPEREEEEENEQRKRGSGRESCSES